MYDPKTIIQVNNNIEIYTIENKNETQRIEKNKNDQFVTIHYVEKMIDKNKDNEKKYPDKNKNESCCTM